MIIKTSARGRWRELADHLTKGEGNERITVTRAWGIMHQADAHGVYDALEDFDDLCELTGGTRPLWHGSISPGRAMTETDWATAWSLYEEAHGLAGQPFVEVEHEKPREVGREQIRGIPHRHRVYQRVKPDPGGAARGTMVSSHNNWLHNELAARRIELALGAEITVGRHNKFVVRTLEKQGLEAEAQALVAAIEAPRPEARTTLTDHLRAARTGVSAISIQSACLRAYDLAAGAEVDFTQALQSVGLQMAQGHSARVVIDETGGTWPLLRSLNKALVAGGRDRIRKAALEQLVAGAPVAPAVDIQAEVNPVFRPRQAPRRRAEAPAPVPVEQTLRCGDEDRGSAVRRRILQREYGLEISTQVVALVIYVSVEDGLFRARLAGGGEVTDHGDLIRTRDAEDLHQAARVALELAKAKRWDSVVPSGDLAWREAIVAEASVMGIEVADRPALAAAENTSVNPGQGAIL